jgi:hypothetical protein
LFATMMKAEQTLHSVFAMLGYDNTGYELGTALVEALTDPECWRRWKEKKKTFRRAVTVPTHYNL